MEEYYWQEMSYRKYTQGIWDIDEASVDDEEVGDWLKEFGADDYSEESMP